MSASSGRIAAFFDMDHTLISRNSGPLYVAYMRRHGRMRRSEMARMLWWAMRYRLGLIDMERVSREALRGAAGIDDAEMRAMCERWIAEDVLQHVYPRARELVAEHMEAGHVVAVLSASTQYAVRPVAAHFGIEHVLCTQLEVVGGKLTGRVVEPMCYGAGKLVWARQFAAEHGVSLERSYFYTDSITDLPVLEAFGQPRPVNADLRLRRAAAQRRWTHERWTPPDLRRPRARLTPPA